MLPAPDSELAQQLGRDPYVFNHLVLSERAAERDFEQALMVRLQDTLLAFGQDRLGAWIAPTGSPQRRHRAVTPRRPMARVACG